MVDGRCAPGRAGVVDQDVDRTVGADDLIDQRRDRRQIADIAGECLRIDAERPQVRDGGVEFVLLARGDRDLGAEFAERLGHLQAEAARAAGDERDAPLEIE
ncbi:hypothetical protein D3C71_1868970 [compost metagenome]